LTLLLNAERGTETKRIDFNRKSVAQKTISRGQSQTVLEIDSFLCRESESVIDRPQFHYPSRLVHREEASPIILSAKPEWLNRSAPREGRSSPKNIQFICFQ
jgi:hypothetical protein